MPDEFGKGKELLELESVQRAIDEAASYAGEEYGRRLRGGIRFSIGYSRKGQGDMESPLEAIFFAWFAALESLLDQDVYKFNLASQSVVDLPSGVRYRFDFRVEFGPQQLSNVAHWRGVPQPKLVIELDGHDFHERTKEQVAKRNERDRDLLLDGWTVLHYSGSELYRDPVKCATSALEACQKLDKAFLHAVLAAPRSEPEDKFGSI